MRARIFNLVRDFAQAENMTLAAVNQDENGKLLINKKSRNNYCLSFILQNVSELSYLCVLPIIIILT